MSFTATLNIDGVPTLVTITDVIVDGQQINITYVDEATSQVATIQMTRALGTAPTKIGEDGVAI